MSDGKLPLLIGGEHLVTLGSLRAVFRCFPELHILHFDAHADLRDDYLGGKAEPRLRHPPLPRAGGGRPDSPVLHPQRGPEEFRLPRTTRTCTPSAFDGLQGGAGQELTQTGAPVMALHHLFELFPPPPSPRRRPPARGGATPQLRRPFGWWPTNVVAADVNELAPCWTRAAYPRPPPARCCRGLLLALSK